MTQTWLTKGRMIQTRAVPVWLANVGAAPPPPPWGTGTTDCGQPGCDCTSSAQWWRGQGSSKVAKREPVTETGLLCAG
jgi:hypothetical protein